MDQQSESIPTLLQRVRSELASLFELSAPATLAVTPVGIDVIGGLLPLAGGAHCVMPIDRYAAALLQPRADRQILIIDFDQLDQQKPFTLQMSIDALASASKNDLQKNLAEPGRSWAGPVFGALVALRDEAGIDLCSKGGFNLALMNGGDPAFRGDFDVSTACSVVLALTEGLVPIETARDLCRRAVAGVDGVSNVNLAALFGSPRSTLWLGREGMPREVAGVQLPEGVRIVGVPVQNVEGATTPGRVRASAMMAHRLVLQKMRDFGTQAGRELLTDPMAGQIGRLEMMDYKRFFRGTLPESIRGDAFLSLQGAIDGIAIDPNVEYAPQLVADHLVIESHRATEFARHLEEARLETDLVRRKLCLDKAGHLMYASHKSQRDNCGFGSAEADRMVDLIRAHEAGGLYGGRLSARGHGAFVSILCDEGLVADLTLRQIVPPQRTPPSPTDSANFGQFASAWRVTGI